jgi:hypothetical protein
MLPPAGEPHDDRYFNRETKCCTYVPRLPNFLVGSALLEQSPDAVAGVRLLASRIEAKVGVSPLGVWPPSHFETLYRSDSGHFGVSRALRCGIWRHRNAVCSTWFCKHERGVASRHFWMALEQLLTAVEEAVARHCVLALSPGPDALRALFPHRSEEQAAAARDVRHIDGVVDEPHHRLVWGSWLGREREYFERAARIAAELSWDEVRRVGGVEIELHERIARDARSALDARSLPDRLRVAPFRVVGWEGEARLVVTYSRYDPLELMGDLVDALALFDGRPTGEALRAIARERGLRLDPALVRDLVDFGVLVPS